MNALATPTNVQRRPGTFLLQPLCMQTHRVANAAVGLLVPIQFYAAGFGIFGAGSMIPHAILGWTMMPLALISAISAAVARTGRSGIIRAFALLGLIVLQPVLAFAPRTTLPSLSALHPVVGLAIGVLAFTIHRRLARGTASAQ
jgi:hypothetical protein